MKTRQMTCGKGKVLISPITHADGSVGIGFTGQLGCGQIGTDHPTIKKGDVVDMAEWDIVINFDNLESLEVLEWAIGEAKTVLKDQEANKENQ